MNRRETPFQFISIGSIPFAVTTLGEATSWLKSVAEAGRGASVRLANAYCVALASRNAEYADVLRESGVNFPDGTPVAWAVRMSGARSATRVRGPSFFESCLSELESTELSSFFLGSTDRTLSSLRRQLSQRFPDLRVCGTYSPPFAAITDAYVDHCVDVIAPTKPDVLWVGLGTPKQDLLTTKIAARLQIPAVGVGAAFDFFAGTVKEAPRFVQNSGFEWLYRFFVEPRRLWQRYTIGNGLFIIAMVKHWSETAEGARRR